jgi:hypothetical protein
MWGDATVTYPDWQGTAQLDQKMTGETWPELVDLEREDWTIVGIDIGGGESGQDLRVIAVDRREYPGSMDDVAANNGGVLPVTEFLIHDVDPYEFLRNMTHVFELRLRARSIVNAQIQVVARGDVPEQS